MGLTIEQKTKRANKMKGLKTFLPNDGKPYVFISYKSDDWEEVLDTIVRKLVENYGLHVYYDTNFDKENDGWIKSMTEAITSKNCTCIISFISKEYLSSYACAMELLYSQTDIAKNRHVNHEIKIIPVMLNGSDIDEVVYDVEENEVQIKEWEDYSKIINSVLDSTKVPDSISYEVKMLKERGQNVKICDLAIAMKEILKHDSQMAFFNKADNNFFDNLKARIEKCAEKKKQQVFDMEIKNIAKPKIEEEKNNDKESIVKKDENNVVDSKPIVTESKQNDKEKYKMEESADDAIRIKYWEKLNEVLKTRSGGKLLVEDQKKSYAKTKGGLFKSKLRPEVQLNKNEIFVKLWIDISEEKTVNQNLFDIMEAQREKFEAKFSKYKFDWRREKGDGKRSCEIRVIMENADFKNENDWARQHDFLADAMIAFENELIIENEDKIKSLINA